MSAAPEEISWHKQLEALTPCREAMEFALRYRTLAGAWRGCTRPHWLCWLLVACGVIKTHECLCDRFCSEIRELYPDPPVLPALKERA